MANYRRTQEPEEEQGRPRRRARQTGPPLAPILGLIVVIIGAIVLARFAAQSQEPEVEPPEPIDASEIYGDLPEELPPEPGARGSGRHRVTNNAPSGLGADERWIEALRVADEATVVLAEAMDAKRAGDHATWNKKGNQAKELYDHAIMTTAAWEDDLREKYGDTDRQVRDIMSTRNKWIDKLMVLHKTTGRD